MVQLIVGEKGKGKTKHLLGMVNEEIKKAKGTICYLDKSNKNLYELSTKIRLIDVSEYMISNADEFVGFISGIISQDHDLEQMYFDSFLKIACLEDKDITATVRELEELGKKFSVNFILSVSKNEVNLSPELKNNILISL
jgi:ABC-type phosphate/phosphonate transport system ATPase subunit